MVIDFHTHIFARAVLEGREEHGRRDPTFAEMYADPRARLADAGELLASMERAEIDLSVVLGFAWSDPQDCSRHNDALLEAAAGAGGRLVPFCTVQPREVEAARREIERVAAAGARGLGELRPDSQGYDLDGPAGDLLAWAAEELGLILLFHVTEPVGHPYPGKAGLGLGPFYRFLRRHPRAWTVGAHWGGGLPLFSPMPEVAAALRHTWVDTAATPLLYSPDVYGATDPLVCGGRVLFGSDFPLLDQGRQRRLAAEALPDDERRRLVLGAAATGLLGLETPP